MSRKGQICGVVDQDVRPPEAVGDLLAHGRGLVGIGHVACETQHRVSFVGEQGDGFLGAVEVDRDDARAACGEVDGDGLADAASGAGDNGHAVRVCLGN